MDSGGSNGRVYMGSGGSNGRRDEGQLTINPERIKGFVQIFIQISRCRGYCKFSHHNS